MPHPPGVRRHVRFGLVNLKHGRPIDRPLRDARGSPVGMRGRARVVNDDFNDYSNDARSDGPGLRGPRFASSLGCGPSSMRDIRNARGAGIWTAHARCLVPVNEQEDPVLVRAPSRHGPAHGHQCRVVPLPLLGQVSSASPLPVVRAELYGGIPKRVVEVYLVPVGGPIVGLAQSFPAVDVPVSG